MSSQKTSVSATVPAATGVPKADKPEVGEAPPRVPKRRRGHERVAALLAAAAAEFAEKGYDAATMTAVAARAGAPIGSLYQFFANKEALAEGLLTRYRDRVEEAFAALESPVPPLSPQALGEALTATFLALRRDRGPLLALMDGHRDPARVAAMRAFMRGRTAAVLATHTPGLAPERRAAIAGAVLQIMKAAAQLEEEGPAAAAALAELGRAAGAYLAQALA